MKCSKCPKDAWFKGLCRACHLIQKKRKAEKEPWRNDSWIKKKWAKQAKDKGLGAKMIAEKKAARKAEAKIKKLRRRARMRALGGPLRDYDEDYVFENRGED